MAKDGSYGRWQKRAARLAALTLAPYAREYGNRIAQRFRQRKRLSPSETTLTNENMNDAEDIHRGINRRNFKLWNGRKPVRAALSTAFVTYSDNYAIDIQSSIGKQGVTVIGMIGTFQQGYSGNTLTADAAVNLTKEPLFDLLPTGENASANIGAFTRPFYSGFVLKSAQIKFNFQNFRSTSCECQLYMLEAKKNIAAQIVGGAGTDTFDVDTQALRVWEKAIVGAGNNQSVMTFASATVPGNVGVPLVNEAGQKPTSYKEFRNHYKIHKAWNFELAGGAAQIVNVDMSTNLLFDRARDRNNNDGTFGTGPFNPDTVLASNLWRHCCRVGGFEFMLVVKGQVMRDAATSKIYYGQGFVGCVVERKFRMSALKDKTAKFRNHLSHNGVLIGAAPKTINNADVNATPAVAGP